MKRSVGRLKAKSRKRAASDRKAKPVRDDYRYANPWCQNGCSLRATDLHEILNGPMRKASMGEPALLLHLCRRCHDEIQEWSLAKQLKLKQLVDPVNYSLEVVRASLERIERPEGESDRGSGHRRGIGDERMAKQKADKPITPAMADALRRIRAGERVVYMPYMGRFNANAYWTLGGSQCTRLVKAMIDRGLLMEVGSGFDRRSAVLTEEGKTIDIDGITQPVLVVYRTGKWDDEIKPCEFAKETAETLVDARGRRTAKHSEYYHYFATWEKAHEHLLDRSRAMIASLEGKLAEERKRLAAIEKMRKP